MEIKSFRGYSSISDSKINEFIADKKMIDIKLTSHAMSKNGDDSISMLKILKKEIKVR